MYLSASKKKKGKEKNAASFSQCQIFLLDFNAHGDSEIYEIVDS